MHSATLRERALTNLELEPGRAVRKLVVAGQLAAVRTRDEAEHVEEVRKPDVAEADRRPDVVEVARTRVSGEGVVEDLHHHLLHPAVLPRVLQDQTGYLNRRDRRRRLFCPFHRRANQTSPRSMPRGRKVLQKPVKTTKYSNE